MSVRVLIAEDLAVVREGLRLLLRQDAEIEIARTLQMGRTIVKTHVSSILSKLGLASRTQAALYALCEGLVRPDGLPAT